MNRVRAASVTGARPDRRCVRRTPLPARDFQSLAPAGAAPLAVTFLATVAFAGVPGRAQEPRGRPLPPGVRVVADLAYVSGGSRAQRLDVYLPEKGDGKRPLVVWVHGGAWRGGSKAECPAIPFAARGYVVASVEYRLSGEARFPAQIEDCKAAVRWLRAHAAEYGIEPARVGAWGSSAGGHLVALLGTSGGVKELEGSGGSPAESSRVQCVVDFFGPTDFTRMHDFPSQIDHDAANSPESQLIGGAIQENKEKAARANPITYVTKDDPPFLIMHGDRDPLVPLSQSELLRDALRKAGVPVTFEAVPGAGHGFGGPEIMRKVEDFFAQHLKA